MLLQYGICQGLGLFGVVSALLLWGAMLATAQVPTGDFPCPLGRAAFDQRNYESAIKEFGACLEGDPDNALLLVLRGLSYNELGRYDSAAKDYEHALETDPETARLYLLPGAFVPSKRIFWATERAGDLDHN